MTSRTPLFIGLASLALVLAATAAPLAAAEFTADIVFTEGDETSVMKLYWDGDRYRIDSERGGQESVILVDAEAHKTIALMPAAKMYLTMDSKAMRTLSHDPFEAYRQTRGESMQSEHHGHAHDDTTEVAMVDTIAGFEVERLDLRNAGGVLMTVWMSEELGVPLRFFVPRDEAREVVLRNIEVGDVDDALFAIPEDYATMGAPQDPPRQGETLESEKEAE